VSIQPAASETRSLKREFSFVSTLALAFAFISPIVALYSIFALGMMSAGPAFWWAFGVVLAGQMLVALVFGELGSRWPLVGGTYQWARRLLGPTYGWCAGWAYMWTFIIVMAAVSYIAAGFLASLIGLDAPSNGTLIFLAILILAIATICNIVGRGLLKFVVAISITAEICASLVIGTILLIFHRENSLSVIFDSMGTGGGTTYIFSGGFLAAVAFIGWSFQGFESAGAVAEEVREPERAVPRAIVFSMLLVGLVVMYAGLAIILAIPDLEAVVAGDIPDPVASTLDAQLGSGVVKPFLTMIVLGFTASLIAIQASVSRTVFSQARHDVIPGARWLRRLSERQALPVNAIVLCSVIAACIFPLTGSNVYTTLVSIGTAGFYVAIMFPTLGALISRRRAGWETGPFTMGALGLWVNAIAVVWLVFETINISWPRSPDLAWYENWGTVLMLGVVTALGAVAYAIVRDRVRADDIGSHSPLLADEERAVAAAEVKV
jgi:amino acid transporter